LTFADILYSIGTLWRMKWRTAS